MKLLVLVFMCAVAAGFCVPLSEARGENDCCDPDLENSHWDLNPSHTVLCNLTQGQRPLQNCDKAKNLDSVTQALSCTLIDNLVNATDWELQDEQCQFVNAGQYVHYEAWGRHGTDGCEAAASWDTKMKLTSADCCNTEGHSVNGCSPTSAACQ